MSNAAIKEPITILVVDDDKDAHLLMKYMLDNSGLNYKSLHAMSTVEAIDVIESGLSIDVAVVDYILSPGTGFDFLQYLEQGGHKIPCIITSMYEDEALEEKAMASGFADQLSKEDVNHRTIKRSVLYAIRNERQKMQLEYCSRNDKLTGLANKSRFTDRLMEVCRCQSQVGGDGIAVYAINIDYFDAINQQYGAEVGDQVLKETAERISIALSDADLIARMANDEFAVLLSDVSLSKANRIKSKIKNQISSPMTIAGERVQLQVSVGVATSQACGYSAKQLLRDAVRDMEKERSNKTDWIS